MANSPKQNVNLPFPIKGIYEVGSHLDQASESTPDAKNVMPFDTEEGRMRGGRRKGINPIGVTLGGRIQLIDAVKTPDSGVHGAAGGTTFYQGTSPFVNGLQTSNINELVQDPNSDGNSDDSLEDTGGIAYRGPSAANDGEMPVDLYESTVIWPTSGSYDADNDTGPMSTASVSTDDMELTHPCDNIPNYVTDPSHLPLVVNGSGNLSTNRDTSLNSGVWVTGTIDDIPGVIYPRPTYNTNGGSGGPSDGTLTPDEHPNAESQGFFIDNTIDSTAVLAGSNVSTALFPACDTTEQPYDSSINDLAGNSNNWCMSATIKTAEATPGYFPKKLSGANHGSSDSCVPFTLTLDSYSSAGSGGTMRIPVSVWWDWNPYPDGMWKSLSVPTYANEAAFNNAANFGSHYLSGNLVAGYVFGSDNKLYLHYNKTEPDGSAEGTWADNWTKAELNLVNPVDLVTDLVVKEKENIERPTECVSESFYGFVFRATLNANPEAKTSEFDNEVVSESEMLFVGFWEKAYPGGVLANRVHEAPKLVVGKVITQTGGESYSGEEAGSPLTTNAILSDVRFACGPNMSGVDEDTGEGTFKNGEWRSLDVRVNANKMSVSVDSGSPVSWTPNESEYDSVDPNLAGNEEIDLASYLGGNADGDTVQTRRMASGIVYYSTRMAQKTANLSNLEMVSAKCYSTNNSYEDMSSTYFSAPNQIQDSVLGLTINGVNRKAYPSLEATGYVADDGTPKLQAQINWFIHSGASQANPDYRSSTTHYNANYTLTLPVHTDTPQGGVDFENDRTYTWNEQSTSFPYATIQTYSDATEAASKGGYQHTFGSSSESAINITGSSTAVNMFDLRRTGYGADWLREWAPAYFRDVRFRDYNPQISADQNKLAVASANGVIRISGDGGNSFGALEGSANPNLQFSADSPIVSGTVMFDRYYMCDGSKYLLIDTNKRRIYNWADMTWNVEKDESGVPLLTDPDGWDLDQDPPVPFDTSDKTKYIPGGNDDLNQKCSLITTWLGRIVMAGKPDEPNNWFMSAIASTDDMAADGVENCNIGPNDWNFAYDGDSAGFGAIAGNSTRLSEIGDPITSIFPFHDKNLVFGCTNSIYILTDDPGPVDTAAEIRTISQDIGILSANSWCHGPNRSLYFFGQNGLYRMAPNEFNVNQANRVSSGRLDKTFSNIDATRFNITLCYDYSVYGVHIFLQPKAAPLTNEPMQHYFYDERTDSLWPMEYPGQTGPSSAMTFNSLDPSSRRVLLGGYDGVIRYFSQLALQDNNATPIDSHVWIGPIFIDNVTETKLMRIAGILDKDSSSVSYEVYVGDTADEAIASSPVITSEWSKGRNPWQYSRARGHSIFVKLSSNIAAVPWAIEKITATIAVAGRARDRS